MRSRRIALVATGAEIGFMTSQTSAPVHACRDSMASPSEEVGVVAGLLGLMAALAF